VVSAETDARVGGSTLIVMKGPDGTKYPNHGIYLEFVRNRKIVFTDAFTDAWTPSEKAFMVVTITFEAEGNKTRYSAQVRHWNAADAEEHVKMGFHEGWGIAPDQLEALVARI